MSSDSANSFVAEATQCLQTGQIQRALENADRAIALQSENAEAWLMRAIALSQLQRNGEAASSFEAATLRNPTSPKILFNNAVHLFGVGQRSEAQALCQTVLQLSPQHNGAIELLELIQKTDRKPMGAFPGDPLASGPPQSQTHTQPYPRPGQIPYDQFTLRSGYDTRHVQSIRWIESMGANWDMIGYLLAGLNIVHAIIFMLVIGVQAANASNTMMQVASTGDSDMTHLLIYLGGMLVNAALVMFWLFDLSNRRGNWLWILTIVPTSCLIACCPICTVCSPLAGIITFFYIYSSRRSL